MKPLISGHPEERILPNKLEDQTKLVQIPYKKAAKQSTEIAGSSH